MTNSAGAAHRITLVRALIEAVGGGPNLKKFLASDTTASYTGNFVDITESEAAKVQELEAAGLQGLIKCQVTAIGTFKRPETEADFAVLRITFSEEFRKIVSDYLS